jgi:hypothetical protein
MTVAVDAGVDLRRSDLATIRAVDFRSTRRDYWADEAAIHDRLVAAWAGLDDAAWRMPGAAPSDAGGPDWSLLDHIAHLVDWWELAAEYIDGVVRGLPWPSEKDYDGGDFDTFNETRRDRFEAIPPADLRRRGALAHERVVHAARQLPAETIRGDAAWGWVHQVLHGHALDHLTVLEPWTDQLRPRQIGNDPFGPDPQPTRRGLERSLARFWSEEASVLAAFDEMMTAVPDGAWRRATGGDWTFADHVGHLATWFEEGANALEVHTSGRPWPAMPPDGVDAFNDRAVRALRDVPAGVLRERFAVGLERLRTAARAMRDDEWLEPEGFSWAYEDLHGHVRAHHAMIGPWAARLSWPAPVRLVAPPEEDR